VASVYIANNYLGNAQHIIKVAIKNGKNDFAKFILENWSINEEIMGAILFDSIKEKDFPVTQTILDQAYCLIDFFRN
jgi:hypothetical protein